jgi:hypothetical protein
VPLADVQARVRTALVTGDLASVDAMLRGGRDPSRRFAIHHRHYETSLVEALLTRYPATVWLLGSDPVTAAARAFVRAYPPRKPCIAEYGEDFPCFLAGSRGVADLPYLADFSTLEWQVGRLALGADGPRVTLSQLAALGPVLLEQSRLALQSGVTYLHVTWNVDELMTAYLSGTIPDRFELNAGDVWLEVRGNRGEVRITRLTHALFAFRVAVRDGQAVGDAAAAALDVDASLDPGEALGALATDGLIARIEQT